MIDQAIYTHSKHLSGWGVVGCTRELDLDLAELIKKRSAYRFPNPSMVSGSAPTRADDEAKLPRSLRLLGADGVTTVVSVRPSGLELSGTGVRGQNIVAHAMIAETAEDLRAGQRVRPIELLGSANLLTEEPEELRLVPLDHLEAGTDVSESSIVERLGNEADDTTARSLVAAVLRAHWAPDADCASVCVVGADEAEVHTWFGIVQYWLPLGLAWQIAFDTFSSRPLDAVMSPPGADRPRVGAILCGTLADLLERGGTDAASLVFDLAGENAVPCEPVGEFAVALTNRSFFETRPFLDTIDDLAECSEVPVDEEGWLTLLHAASLLLGAPLSPKGQRAVARWMADHAEGLGQGRVEVFALSLDRDALPADGLLAVMAAGSAVGSSTVVQMFEGEAFNRALQVALDRRLADPKLLRIDWSPELVARAALQITAELERSPADIAVRLIRFAAAMELDLPSVTLGDVGCDLLGLILARQLDASAFPERYRLDILSGLIGQLDADPLPESSIPVLQAAITELGLSEAIDSFSLAEHPVAAIQIRLRPDADDADRLAVFVGLFEHGAIPWSVIDNILKTIWPLGSMRLEVFTDVVAGFGDPAESSWLPVVADQFVAEAESIEQLVKVEALLDKSGIGTQKLSVRSRNRLEPLALLREALRLNRRDARGRQILKAMEQVKSRKDALALDLVRRIGEYATDLDATDVLSLYVKARDLYDPEEPQVQALNEGVLRAVHARSRRSPEDGVDMVARVAPALLQMQQSDTLTAACRQLVPKWDATRMAEVTQRIGGGPQYRYARVWEKWAPEHLKHRFMR